MEGSIDEAPGLPEWLLRDYPFCRHRIQIGPWRMHYVDEGTGRPVLLMHGNPTWSYLWRKVIPPLVAAGHRVIAPDMLGLGLSDKPRDPAIHTLDFHVSNLAALVSALDLENLVVAGQDWGGPQVAGMAARMPGRVTGAVFANTSLSVPGDKLRTTRFHRFSHLPLVSTLAFRGLNFPVPIMHKAQGEPESIGKAQRRAYAYPLRGWANRAAPLALARMVPHRREHPTIPEIAACEAWARGFSGPVGLVWGLRDPILGRSLRRMRALFPDAPVTETQAGHFLQEEVPEILAKVIAQIASR